MQFMPKTLLLSAASLMALGACQNATQTAQANEELKAKNVILFVGALELPELQRQSASYASVIKGYCASLNHHVIKGKNHYSILQELMLKNGVISQVIKDLMISQKS